MKIEDLNYFISVAETGSITKAAQQHFMTQQGLSRIISNMERELGTSLLVRKNNKIRLTPAGELVVESAREIGRTYGALVAGISRISQSAQLDEEIDFTIYATPIMLNTVIPSVLTGLNRIYPKVRFSVIERNVWEIASDVQFSDDDIALISWPPFHSEMYDRLKTDTLHFETLFKDRIALGVPKGHPLTKRDVISISELSTLPFAAYYNEKDLLQRLLGDNYEPNILIHTTPVGLCHEMVERGIAFAPWSDLVDFYAQTDAIVRVPIERTVTISYGCLWSTEQPLSPIAQTVVALAKEEFQRVSLANRKED